MSPLITQEKIPHLGGFSMLPPRSDVCHLCATKHDPSFPHNKNSMFYQYRFYGEHGRFPTWADAMAHCTDQMRRAWSRYLGIVTIEHYRAGAEEIVMDAWRRLAEYQSGENR